MRRRLIRILIGIVALFVITVVAVRLFVSPEAVQQFLFAELESRTGIHAEADEASIQFPWPVGLRLKGLRLSTPEGGQGQAVRLEAEVEEALATADLMSLIRKAPQVQEVRLQKPRLELWLANATGAPDAADDAGAGADGEAPAPEAAGIALALSLLSIEDGHFVIHQADASTITVEGVQQRVHFQIDAQQSFSGRLQTSLSSLRMEGGSRETPLLLGELEAEVLLSGGLDPLSVQAQLPSFSGEGLSGRGKILYELREERPYLESEIEWSMDPDALLDRVRETTAKQDEDPLEGIQLALESLSGSAQLKGLLPQETEDPGAWLSLLQLRGVAEGLQVGAFGQAKLVQGRGQFHLEGENVVLEALELKMDGLQAEGRLLAPALGVGELTGKLQLQADAAALQKRMRSIWPALPDSVRAKATPPEDWPGLSGGLSGELSLKLPLPAADELPADAVRASLRLKELKLTHEGLSSPLVLHEGVLLIGLERANIEGLRFSADGLAGSLEGVVDSWPEKIRFVGRGAFAELDLDRLRPSDEEPVQTGQASWGVRAAYASPQPEPFVPPANLEVQMTLEADRLRTRGYLIRDLKGMLDLSNQVLELTDLNGKVGSGRLVGSAELDWTAPQPRWKTRLEAIGIPAQALLSPAAPQLGSALQTELSGMILLEGDLLDDRVEMLQSLAGGGALKGTAGEFLTTALLGDGLNALPGTAGQKLRAVAFKDFLTTVSIDAGRATFSETVMRGPTQLRAEGWAGFDGQVDYVLELKLPVGEKLDLGSLTPLAEFLRTEDGRITVPVRISGRGKKPKVSLELGGAEQRAREAAQGEIEDKVKGFLKGLTGKNGGG